MSILGTDDLTAQLTGGVVILCPVANPTAFDACSNPSPRDDVNLNRAGNLTADTFSARSFTWLAEVISATSAVLVDLHGGGNYLTAHHFAMVAAREEPLYARAEGLLDGIVPYLVKLNGSKGTLIEAVSARGTVGILLESGCGGVFTNAEVETLRKSVIGLLAKLGMLGDAVPPVWYGAPEAFHHELELFLDSEAVLVSYQETGARVDRGDPILRFADRSSLEQRWLTSPMDGAILLAVRAAALIRPGSYAAYLAHN